MMVTTKKKNEKKLFISWNRRWQKCINIEKLKRLLEWETISTDECKGKKMSIRVCCCLFFPCLFICVYITTGAICKIWTSSSIESIKQQGIKVALNHTYRAQKKKMNDWCIRTSYEIEGNFKKLLWYHRLFYVSLHICSNAKWSTDLIQVQKFIQYTHLL